MQKSLLAMVLLVASSMPMAAQACAGCGIKFNGISSNGLQLNGARLNGIEANGLTLNGWTLNGYRMNGLTLNGLTLNGFKINGRSFNGTLFNGTGAWRAVTVARAASVDGWSAIPLDQVRVRLPLAR